MKTLLETIKEHDAKMESSQREVELLSQALRLIMDDLIDNNLTLCLDSAYVKHAFQVLKDRGEIDSFRERDYKTVQSGNCDISNLLEHEVRNLNNKYSPVMED